MLLKGQERVGDRKRLDIEGERREEDTSGVISRVHFIVRVLPDISPLLIRSHNRHGCRRSQQGEGGLEMPHGGRTAVKNYRILQHGSLLQSGQGSYTQVLIWL